MNRFVKLSTMIEISINVTPALKPYLVQERKFMKLSTDLTVHKETVSFAVIKNSRDPSQKEHYNHPLQGAL